MAQRGIASGRLLSSTELPTIPAGQRSQAVAAQRPSGPVLGTDRAGAQTSSRRRPAAIAPLGTPADDTPTSPKASAVQVTAASHSRWRIGSAGASTRGYYLKQQRTGEVRRPSARLNEHGTSPRCMHRRTAWSAYRRTGAESAVHLTSARRGPDSAWILMGVRSVRKVRQAQARGPT